MTSERCLLRQATRPHNAEFATLMMVRLYNLTYREVRPVVGSVLKGAKPDAMALAMIAENIRRLYPWLS